MALTRKRVNDVLDCDIRGFFDTLSHEWLVKLLQHRVADPRILRLIQKWLRAGVSEEGQWSETTVGVPPGAVVSPLLATVYLHDVFDLWVEAWRTRTAQGAVVVVRLADDGGLGFEHRSEAERCLAAMRDRLHPFGLALQAEKTRLIECGPHAIANRKQRGEGKPETFDCFGFHAHLREAPKDGRLHGPPQDGAQAQGGEAASHPTAAAPTATCANGTNGPMAHVGRARVFQLPCGARQHADPRDLPAAGYPTLAETALPPQSESPPALAAAQTLDPTLDSHPAHPASVSECAL